MDSLYPYDTTINDKKYSELIIDKVTKSIINISSIEQIFSLRVSVPPLQHNDIIEPLKPNLISYNFSMNNVITDMNINTVLKHVLFFDNDSKALGVNLLQLCESYFKKNINIDLFGNITPTASQSDWIPDDDVYTSMKIMKVIALVLIDESNISDQILLNSQHRALSMFANKIVNSISLDVKNDVVLPGYKFPIRVTERQIDYYLLNTIDNIFNLMCTPGQTFGGQIFNVKDIFMLYYFFRFGIIAKGTTREKGRAITYTMPNLNPSKNSIYRQSTSNGKLWIISELLIYLFSRYSRCQVESLLINDEYHRYENSELHRAARMHIQETVVRPHAMDNLSNVSDNNSNSLNVEEIDG
ncbi:tubular protein [Diaphorina citri reovirus]|nr:tubular protein [Diaphorina citri reovirus]